MSQQNSTKKLVAGTGIYAVGTFGTKILMFLIAPLYTYYLARSEMGTYDILISTIGLLLPIVSLQISDAVYRWIIQDDSDSEKYLCTAFQFLAVSSFLAVAVIGIISCFIQISHLYFFIGAFLSSMFFQTSQKILRGLKRQWLFAISGIVYTCIFLVLNIVQLCILHKGVESLLMSYIVANAGSIITILIFEKRMRIRIFRKIDLLTLKALLSYSIPLIPNNLSWWVVDSSDRYIVLWFLGVSSNGILAIAHKFPTILQAVVGLFLNSWQDLSVATKEAEKEFYSAVFRKVSRFLLMLIWTIVPVTKVFVLLIMSKDYKVASDYIPFYYLGAVFQAFCSFYGVGYLRTKNTKGAFSTSIYGAIINAAINIGLIRYIGIHAAAVSTFIAFFVMWLIRERQNRGELGITVLWPELFVFLTIDILICVASITGGLMINIVLSIIGAICFIVINWKDITSILLKLKNHTKAK